MLLSPSLRSLKQEGRSAFVDDQQPLALSNLALEAPYDDLAQQIGEAAYKVTDEHVAKVVEEAGSERAAFELIVASALGAGLHRWRRGLKVLEEAML